MSGVTARDRQVLTRIVGRAGAGPVPDVCAVLGKPQHPREIQYHGRFIAVPIPVSARYGTRWFSLDSTLGRDNEHRSKERQVAEVDDSTERWCDTWEARLCVEELLRNCLHSSRRSFAHATDSPMANPSRKSRWGNNSESPGIHRVSGTLRFVHLREAAMAT